MISTLIYEMNKHNEMTLGSWMRGDALPSAIVCSFADRPFATQQESQVWSGGSPT